MQMSACYLMVAMESLLPLRFSIPAFNDLQHRVKEQSKLPQNDTFIYITFKSSRRQIFSRPSLEIDVTGNVSNNAFTAVIQGRAGPH